MDNIVGKHRPWAFQISNQIENLCTNTKSNNQIFQQKSEKKGEIIAGNFFLPQFSFFFNENLYHYDMHDKTKTFVAGMRSEEAL